MKRFIFSCAVLLFAAGCGSKSGGGAPEIAFGKDPCSRCGMIVSEARFASGYRDAQGESVAFDDLGEAFEAVGNTVGNDGGLLSKMYVAGMDDLKWLPMSEAHYVRVEGFATPMGSGIAAFSTAEQAGAFAARHGASAKNFNDMRSLLREGRSRP